MLKLFSYKIKKYNYFTNIVRRINYKFTKKVLETFVENISGKLSNNNIITKTIDTTNISQQELLNDFLKFANSIVLEDSERKVKVKK